MVVQFISVALYTRLKDFLDGAVSCAVFKHSVPVIHSNGYIITTTVLTNRFTHLYIMTLQGDKHKCQGHVGTYRHRSNTHDREVIAVQ